jgi:hypothetical protein
MTRLKLFDRVALGGLALSYGGSIDQLGAGSRSHASLAE